MVGGFIRWDRLFEGSPTQDGKEVAERGAFAPVVEYDDQTHAFGLPGLITEPWQAMKRWLNGGAEENVARMRTGLPFTDEAAGDAFSIAGSAAMGSVAAPKPSGAYVTSGAGGNPKSKGVQHPGIRAAYQWRSKDAEPELQTSPKSHRVMEFDDDLARDAMRNYGEGAPPTSGYVLPDGTFLDFSEGSGMRSLDHRDVNSLLPEHLKIDPSSYGARAKEMDNFMAASRAMRWQPESPGFEVNMMPTREQLRAAANAAQDYWPDTPFMVDVSDPVSGSVVRSKTFERPTFGALEGFFRRLSDEGVDLYANPKESAALNAAIQGERQSQKGIRAYHGSPHDFDRFDISKIGTGEGSQAYGYGLYFAEAEDVARSYRDVLSKAPWGKARAGEEFFEVVPADHYGSVEVRLFRGGDYGEPEFVKSFGVFRDSNEAASALQKSGDLPSNYQSVADPTDGEVSLWNKNPGRMYEVRINADPEDFLDWDKPLSQQSEKVREGVRNSLVERGIAAPVANYLRNSERPGRDALTALARGEYDTRLMPPEGEPAALASAKLRDAGIPGIKYLDQGSRAAGEGSRNYVVFDDSLIEIVKKYGIAGAASLYGMTQGEIEQALADQGQGGFIVAPEPTVE